MTATVSPPSTITLRIETEMVPPRVRDGVETVFGIQDKARNLLELVQDAEGVATFEITVTSHRNAVGDLDWRGPFVHGKPGERFLYLGWRPFKGLDDNWIRRWKISLTNLPTDSEMVSTRIASNEAQQVWPSTNWQPITDH